LRGQGQFALEVDGKPCGIVPGAIGGSYAVLVAEQLLASGARMVVGLTSAGRVSQTLRIPSLVIATAAIRDEGTSFHYLPPSKSVAAPPSPVAPLTSELERLGLPVYQGTVWTTDAPYRETQQQLDEYDEEGVLAVWITASPGHLRHGNECTVPTSPGDQSPPASAAPLLTVFHLGEHLTGRRIPY
jgi:uridine phosphorylase